MLQIDRQSGVPIYDQLIKGIIHLKTLGVLKPHEQLPSVRSLAMSLGINPNTVQKAYQMLETRGFVYSISGKGSFLSDSKDADDTLKNDVLKRLEQCLKEAKQVGIEREKVEEIVIHIFADGGKKND